MKWQDRRVALIGHLAGRTPPHVPDPLAHAAANARMVGRALDGLGPDDPAKPGRGVRPVVNMASVHVPGFCAARGRAYLNAYDLGKHVRLEALEAGADIPVRSRIDHALWQASGIAPETIYFAAAELNGSGVRFYGDVCLVLAGLAGDDTPVVESNSYDALRPPRIAGDATRVEQGDVNAEVDGMTGRWNTDLADIAAIKVLVRIGDSDRVVTTGQISDAILHDEAYVEILLDRSFDIKAVEEARSSVADTAVEHEVAEAGRLGRAPAASEFEWRNQRRAARVALVDNGRQLRTVPTAGRVR